MFETTSTAARKLGIAASTVVSLESRGIVGPFQRDAAGRRLISEKDMEGVRQHMRTQPRGNRGLKYKSQGT